MKTLIDLRKGERAVIKKIHASGELKTRFMSLGIQKGATVLIEECAPAKQTIQVKVGSMILALRHNEAEEVELDA